MSYMLLWNLMNHGKRIDRIYKIFQDLQKINSHES
jgi:hypothetical protein